MTDPIIEVDEIFKKYRLGVLGTGTLRHDFNRWLHRLAGKPDPYAKLDDGGKIEGGKRAGGPTGSRVENLPPPSQNGNGPARNLSLAEDEIWALRGASFNVKKGEVLGIIGRNGAGKSTLLKILSRVTAPTGGEVRVKGRIASLLEVGTGFHPELTGRENIFLNGAILGMTKVEITRKFDEIVAFAEVEKFLDTPVKRYSSGMYVRLAFAVAAHLEAEILIVDEVLAVGDAEFQKKCLGKMQDVSRQDGRSVLFVSHNMAAVQALCTRVVVVQDGIVHSRGDVKGAIDFYCQLGFMGCGSSWSRPDSLGRPDFRFEKIGVTLEGQQPRLVLRCGIELTSAPAAPDVFVAVDVCDRSGTPIMQAVPVTKPFIRSTKGCCRLDLEIDLPGLIPGQYMLDFWIGSHYTITLDYIRNALAFEVLDSVSRDRSFPHSAGHGFLVAEARCRVDYDKHDSTC